MQRFFTICLIVLTFCASAQITIPPLGGQVTSENNTKQHASWTYEVSPKQASVGQEVNLILRANVEEGWYVYSSDFDPTLGPIVTNISFKNQEGFVPVGKLKSIHPKRKMDEVWGGEVAYFIGKGEFHQKIKILKENAQIEGAVEYQTCTIKDGACVGGEWDFRVEGLTIKPAVKENSKIKPKEDEGKDTVKTTPKPDPIKIIAPEKQKTLDKSGALISPITVTEDLSLWSLFFKAFVFGLAALITPCVFPMIPMTVSFFTNSSKSRGQAIRKGLLYGLSIIFIYTVLGVLVASLFGAEAANFISTHWFPNILFFLIFVIFASSFLGLFEITLPSSLVNRVDKHSEKGGMLGIFFMAFTIALVSFSCTGPIVGTVLIQSAGGKFMKPIVGMFGFSLAFAIPFATFAMFPSWLKSLPKSGGWLNSVKVCLGFIELALALKFFSQADQVYHWRLLDREIFIALWIVIFSLLGLYLIKKFKLSHDDYDYTERPITVPRIILAILTFAFVVYMIPGMFGAPLKALSGYLPPMATSDFLFANATPLPENEHNALCEEPKHADLLHLPHGLKGYFDLEQAQACAKKRNKPLFIDFTGHGCSNCREMEANVWSEPEVLKRLQEDFIIVSLYVDERRELPKDEWYISPFDGKEKKTIGKQNADLEIRLFNHNAQPLYAITDVNLKPLLEPKGYDRNIERFKTFLKEGKESFKNERRL